MDEVGDARKLESGNGLLVLDEGDDGAFVDREPRLKTIGPTTGA